MKSFNTLRGFLADDEADGAKPTSKHYATLRIFSETGLNFEEIGSTLGVVPTATLRIGGRIGPRSPPSKGDLWMYRAPVPEIRDLGEHVLALWQALKPHADFIRTLKTRATVEILLGYSSNIDHGGVRISHTSVEMFTALGLDVELSIVVVTDD